MHSKGDSAAELAASIRVVNNEADYSGLVAAAATARIVLIGEASHGTREFYDIRARLTRRLIAEAGFQFVLLEADWPDTLRVHRHIHGKGEDRDAAEALGGFRRFPAWMWRNTVMVDFVEWLRDWNTRHPRQSCGLFGLDLYSMHASIEAVLAYLQKVDPEAAARARKRYGCFEFFGRDPQAYGYATVRQGAEPCEQEVVAQLTDLRRQYGEYLGRDGQRAEDEFFYAEQNARLAADAEQYYRSMFQGRDESWNLRDRHMTETLAAVREHFGRRGPAKVVVWAHNSHLGDARATSMSERGEWNVGQLARERFGTQVFSIGFSTYAGTVTAARDWGEPAERRRVRPALEDSYEELFHQTGVAEFWIPLREALEARVLLTRRRLQRAIGVIYRPETERWSHYYEACLPRQFDAVIHLDRTTALEPLERTGQWERGELEETYPSGL